MKKYIVGLIIVLCVHTPVIAADLTIWFGNTDGKPLIAKPGEQLVVPVWIYTRPNITVAAVHIPLSSDDRLIIKRLEPIIYRPFNKNLKAPEGYEQGWDVASTLDPMPHKGMEGYTSQSLLGFCSLTRIPNIPLECEDTCKVLEFPMIVSGDDSLKGNTYDVFIEGWQGPSQGFHFSDTSGTTTFSFDAHFSKVHFVYTGDINDDHTLDISDIDALQSYFIGKYNIPWPIERADCNNDQIVDKDDINCLRKIIE